MNDQRVFETVYRGRQGRLHHLAYMRMSKVLLARHVLSLANVSLEGKRVFDYGFGAGTFFRYCPSDAVLAGVEIDPKSVHEVETALRKLGFRHLDLRPITLETWKEHPLLHTPHDLILCSHVLEHLSDPVEFLLALSLALSDDGVLVGLLPINERELNPHHVQPVSDKVITGWLQSSGLELLFYLEADPWLYWLQPLYNFDANHSNRAAVLLARSLSLMLGAVSTGLGPGCWNRLGKICRPLLFSRNTQAAFVARRRRTKDARQQD